MRAGLNAIFATYQDLLAAAFAADAGVDPVDDPLSRMLAALLVSGNQEAVRKWVIRGGGEDLATYCEAVIEFAFRHVSDRNDLGDLTTWLAG